MCRTDLRKEVDLLSPSLIQQIVTKLNNISDTISDAKNIKLNEATLPSRNSEMEILETFSWRCQWPPGIPKAAKRGYRKIAEKEVQGRTLVKV